MPEAQVLLAPHAAAHLVLSAGAVGLVVLAPGEPAALTARMAEALQAQAIATLVLQGTPHGAEEADGAHAEAIATQVEHAMRWATHDARTAALPLALFGAGEGGAAVLIAAGRPHMAVAAVVSCGGRPDLAGPALPLCMAPVCLVVGDGDPQEVVLHRQAAQLLPVAAQVAELPGVPHDFGTPEAVEAALVPALGWLARALAPAPVG